MSEKERIEMRLAQLREEAEKGQQMLADLDRQRNDLQQQLLRIQGAIQVLEEMAAGEPLAASAGEPSAGE